MKFCGMIGFATTVETSPDVYVEQIVEKRVYGTVVRNTRKLQTTAYTNSDVDLNDEFHITGNSRLRCDIASMRYIVHRGSKWRITSADDTNYPTIIIQVGGVYNENTY